MAPVKPKRPSIRSRTARSSSGSLPHPRTTYPSRPNTGFANSKKDKRTIKHSSFVSKIEKADNKAKKRRRRPTKKLVATLESLADALPGNDEVGGGEQITGDARIRQKSLKSRPGAMKRKEKLEMIERERFDKNMAQMAPTRATVGSTTGGVTSTSERWTALRAFISQTMEQKTEFRNDTKA
ncbi:MAG: hypothetical protein M1827_003082 [Pycnora praestabilis]|nr:MAG: hypothetical protein M1827_003082 [Pycnora praestabilis]